MSLDPFKKNFQKRIHYNVLICFVRKPNLTERAFGARSAQDIRKRNGAGAGPPVQPGPSKGFLTKKDVLMNLGLIAALPPMTAKS